MRTEKPLSPGRKAQRTARWARIMTKWLITYSNQRGARWQLVDFCGKAKSESRGIVDLVAIRKNHRSANAVMKRGDTFEIVLIQVKGGRAPRPVAGDIARLRRVAKYHNAKAVILAEWQPGEKLDIFLLDGTQWKPIKASAVFG